MGYTGSQAVTGKGASIYIGPGLITSATTSGSANVTGLPAGIVGVTLVVGSLVSGTGIPAGATVITATPGSTTVTLSAAATATGTPLLTYQTLLGEVRGVSQSGAEAAEEDVTNLESTAKEIITTINDEGTFDFTCNRVAGDGGQILLQNGFVNQSRYSFTVQTPKQGTQTTIGDAYTGVCYVKSRGFAFEPTKAQQFTAKLRITGSLTFVAGS